MLGIKFAMLYHSRFSVKEKNEYIIYKETKKWKETFTEHIV